MVRVLGYFFLIGILVSAVGGCVWVCLAFIVFKIRITSHLVVTLLSLEVLSLSTLLAARRIFFRSRLISGFVLRFFTIIVCEACIGLGALVITSRSRGSDKLTGIY